MYNTLMDNFIIDDKDGIISFKNNTNKGGRGHPTNLHNLTKQKKYRRTRSKSSKRNNKKSII